MSAHDGWVYLDDPPQPERRRPATVAELAAHQASCPECRDPWFANPLDVARETAPGPRDELTRLRDALEQVRALAEKWTVHGIDLGRRGVRGSATRVVVTELRAVLATVYGEAK